MKSTGKTRPTLIFFLVLGHLLTKQAIVRAQDGNIRFFLESGHSVQGEFLRYYDSVPDPKRVFGYPITEQMVSRDGRTVQYFQRARFELAADLAGRSAIQLTSLGRALYTPGEPQVIHNPRACQFINNTGFPICFQFLDFYRSYGGPDIFGSPISPLERRNGVIVQHFEKARLEWRTDGFIGRVVPADLGRIYFDVLGEDPAERYPFQPRDATIDPVLSLNLRAYVSRAITQSSGDQTVYVIVRSQTDQPIMNASGTAAVHLPDGTGQTIHFTTDSRGMAQISFQFGNQKAGGLTLIEVTATYLNLTAKTTTSFRIWF